MPCHFPLYGYKSNKLSDNGKRVFVSARKDGYIDQPVTVPCGQCIGCRIDRSREWALRCYHESKFHSRSCFATLTFDDEYLPADGCLDKTVIQKFMKRLRFHFPDATIRFFACGEYGEDKNRPHYHIILFGIDFYEDRKKHSIKKDKTYYTSETLSKIWGFGHCLITNFSYANAAYTARYIMKKQMGKNAQEHEQYETVNEQTGELFQRTPEFALMSRNPGLGSSWYDKYKTDAFPSDFLVVDGKKHPVPRFYVNKLKKQSVTEHAMIVKKRKRAREANASESTTDRLRVKHEVLKSKIKTLSRTL